MKTRRNYIRAFILLSTFILISLAFLLVYLHFKPFTSEGSKAITVEVIIPKEKDRTFHINTDAKYLGQALEKKKLIHGTQGAYGLFITEVNGHTADDSKQEWWCITKDRKMVNTGVDSTPIKDKDHFELTLKTGY